MKSFNRALPVLNNKLVQIKALSGGTPTSANITESIIRIKDIINEARNFVNRISAATTFNGKGHVELHPPKKLEDIKAFTAVDLSLNHHHSKLPKSDQRRKRHQHRCREDNLFVFYLGNKNASGDYIGMAIRNTVLICVCKLGGIIHKVETSQITVTNVNSSNFDRVFFRRVYQDAEVNITQNYTSQTAISLPPVRNLPNTTTGVLSLNPDSVVFYVGGYPEDFIPPEELRYHKYRGAIKFSYINDSPVSLFNYKRAVNMDLKQPAAKISQTEVSDYYEGTGYRMAFIKHPEKKTRRLFKFHTNSPEMNALLFYIENEESFFCVFVARGLLVLRGQQADREVRVQSPDRVSLSDKQFAIIIADRFIVHYGSKEISTDYIKTRYTRYYIGGLPAQLRQRHNITAAPLRGCVDHLTADAEVAEYNRTLGVSGGCPVSVLGVHAATLFSPLAIESLFVWNEPPIRVSLSFRSKYRHAVLLESSSQDFQLSLADGFLVFKSYNCTLWSDKRYSDGVWHYLSVEWMPTGVELSIDNVNVTLGQSSLISQQEGKFPVCIENIYARRPDHALTPADLSVLSLTADIFPGQCRLHPPSHGESVPKKPQKHKPTTAGSQCRQQQTQHEYQLSEANSWLSYTLPQQDLDYRPHFSLHFMTKTSKGLILHVAGRGVIPLLALYIANGKIKMSLGPNRTIQHKQKSNDGNWHKVELSIEKSTFHLLVDEIRVTDGRLPKDEGSSLDFHNPVYLGGDPERSYSKEHNVPTNSVIGCIRDFKMYDVAVSQPNSRHKILPCFDGRTEIGTYFSGGHIVLDHFFTVGSRFELSFELRPQHLLGLLFHLQSGKTSLNVYLMENKVGVKMKDGDGAVSVSVKPRKNLCDGKFHVVQVSKQHAVIKLVVDPTEGPSTSSSTSAARLYIGGTTNRHIAPVSSPFIGCLRNVRFNRKSVGFEMNSRVFGPVSVNKCPAES
ncbi:laminin subunit alpha-3-like isoform X2 [Melanotaenia boesemani]|uniref:laminin subunit alpha-3-like isoform X2 n=1 Tax=Melanotaenia boesemani TaxID=1250792 RepID=UPI001C05D2FC|nr:laminin subunit alpha-3-like isoform X2 [Melanotaenia boesemani]